MIVPVLAGTAVLVVGGWWLLMALVGRSTVPAWERVPLRAWRPGDVLANAAQGVASVVELDRTRRARPSRTSGSSY